ncbi:hypothetical protein CBS14141_001879 [Malassezia furfur]|nr:hypothetical protein CBS14141_001879 [Malassezia furfur]
MWLKVLGSLAALGAAHYLFRRVWKGDRTKVLPPPQERIVILGASSVNGIGAAIAQRCLDRGSYNNMLVGRRSDALREVKMALIAAQETEEGKARAEQLELFVADCSDYEDVLRLSLAITRDFGGLDTLYVVFGAISTQSLLGVAGMDPAAGSQQTEPTLENLRDVSDTAGKLCAANVTGTALVFTALIPHLQTNSKSPYVVVIGSLGSLVWAPTRSLYCGTKSAQQMLTLSVAAECTTQARVEGRKLVRFAILAPSTVATSFTTRLAVGAKGPLSRTVGNMLTPKDVGDIAVRCADTNRTGVVPVPSKYFFAWLLAPLLPGTIERAAHRRYGY